MLDSSKISIVFQGWIDTRHLSSGLQDGRDFMFNVQQTRQAYPNAQLILSTWDNVQIPAEHQYWFDQTFTRMFFNADPGGLPNIKFGYDGPNNVNRQMVSTVTGLAAVTTPYAIKLRTESYLSHAQASQFYSDYCQLVQPQRPDYSPILVVNFFTIDPVVYEHMAYHISDWAQFGRTDTLLEYWSGELMTFENATYFEHNAHHQHHFVDDQFRTRLAVEQHITTQYARQKGYVIPDYYNQITADILSDHQRFLAEHIIVLNMAQFGLHLPKYQWAISDDFMALNCVHHEDWYATFQYFWQLDNPDTQKIARAMARQLQKRIQARDITIKQLAMSLIYPSAQSPV